MTDGYVGNGVAIIDAVKKNAGVARGFSFGTGEFARTGPGLPRISNGNQSR